MADRWEIPSSSEPSPFHLPEPVSRCTYWDWSPCRICFEALPDITSIHPLQIYRWWNRYYDYTSECNHVAVPWLIVEPFLLQYGYRLMRRGDDPAYVGEEGDKLWLGDHEQAKFTSPHTYPAYDRSGKMVFIKTVPLHSQDSQEYDIWRMLDSPKARAHPDNHTVPIREILYFNPDFAVVGAHPEPTDARLFVVMNQFDTVTPEEVTTLQPGYPFVHTIEDLYQFFLQMAQAVRYMHDLGIAHQDIMDKNFLIDCATPVDRCYVIDFQLSLYFPKPWTTPPRILIDAEAPEAFRPTKPYDPFPVDVFCVGTIFDKMIRAFQRSGWTSLDELNDIAQSMRRRDPEQRPTIHAVENRLQDLIKALNLAAESNHA
ncbi:hypothetical protein FRC04_009013 [Tulasnella sp. 424]|nr:hypothetical protein FRC04_009013 [Tulasnella sp. 424]KAG8973667.1 hypothetical protein FRC05_008604 [Tulasnella sp. 425]